MLDAIIKVIGKDWAKSPKVHDRITALSQKYSYIDRYLSEYKQGGKSALDLSCGNGALLEILRHYGNEVMGVEVEYFLYLKSQNIPHIKHDCSLIPYPFADQSFDLVSSIGAISFYDIECKPALDEMFRIARKTVFLVVNTGEYLDQYGEFIKGYCPTGWKHSVNNDSTHKWTHV